ncbi:MAG TPA: HAD family hydrolase [Bacillota bacterium]|nr:HAD family hydrolase [Bacillota bacterium]HPT87167.1 HAD family hydrolase [Bacillota bacterium]
MPNAAIFLDRDGVINDNTRHVNHPRDLVLYPWVSSAIRQLKEAGYYVFIVTNQGGIELGFLTHRQLEAIHSQLRLLLAAENAEIDEIVYCPHFHHPCNCRKPKPGMLQTLIDKYHLDPALCWMIGDRETDSMAGKAAGCRTIKLGDPDPYAEITCTHLGEAAERILCLKAETPL